MFKPFTVETIPKCKHRYDTCGDWTDSYIRVTDMGNPVHEGLIALHEHAEKLWCETHGVLEADVTAFDMAYEETRTLALAPCGCEHFDEPGDDPHAPYYKGHQLATVIEHMMAIDFNVNWITYNQGSE